MKRRKPQYGLYIGLLSVLAILIFLVVWSGTDQPDQPAHQPVHAGKTHRQTPVYEDEKVASRLRVVEAIPRQAAIPSGHGISLILDDVGQDLHAVQRILDLPYPVTLSILPYSLYAKQAAEMTHQAHHLVMLHLPMEPANPVYRAQMDSGFLRATMSHTQIQVKMRDALQHVPYVEGVNNHMGSYLTTMMQPMTWVMDICRKHHLFFVDSRTSKDTVAAVAARKAKLTWGERHVFLDNSPDEKDMQAAWKIAMKKARREGSCIVIAHPHSTTLSFLEKHIPKNEQHLLVPLKQVLHP